jgi:hypothetical protein
MQYKSQSLKKLNVKYVIKTGRHDIAEILLKVALKHHKSKLKSTKTNFSSVRHR